jgi:predicted permease
LIDEVAVSILRLVTTCRQDLAYAGRSFRNNPGFTATAVVTLALGLGANATIFSFVDAVLLKPLPYPDPERLLMVFEKPPGGMRNAVSAQNFLDWRESSKSADLVASAGTWLTMTGRGEPQKVQARVVSYDYFSVLGTAIGTGRAFLPEEGQPGKERVLLLSHRFWFHQLGGDPAILEQTLSLDGSPYKVIGTLPAGSWFDRHSADVWMPLAITHVNSSRDFHYLQVYGRLHSGSTRTAAAAELDTVAARIGHDYPASNKGWGVTVDLLADRVVNDQLRQTLYVLFAAVGVVVLIACVNLANLLLARAAAREREIWVRLSLGAGRTRLLRQFLTESLALGLSGGAAGGLLGYVLMKALLYWLPEFTLPTQAEVRLDWRVLAYLFSLVLASSALFGLAPAIAAWRRDVAEGLREGHRGATGSLGGRRFRSILIVTEVALAFVLVASAGVLIHSFMRLTGVDLGVGIANVLTMQLPRAMGRDIDPARETVMMNRVRDAVAALPGVTDAGLTSAMPMQSWGFGMPFEIHGRSAASAQRSGGGFKIVSPNYFRTVGMKLLRGRSLADTDRAGAPPATVINQTMAKQIFKDDDPIGQHVLVQRIVTGKHELGAPIPWEIVGVYADEKVNGLDGAPSPGVYVTFEQSPIVGMGLVVRSHGDPTHMIKGIQAAIWWVNPNQAVTDVKLLEQIKTEHAGGARFSTFLLGGFAGLALMLAAVGIYGVVAYTVAQRTREIGIRAALGATRPRLLLLALRHSIGLALAGMFMGLVAIRWTSALMKSLLFNTQPTEPETLAAVAVVLIAVVVAASFFPARRAAGIDPSTALRHE